MNSPGDSEARILELEAQLARLRRENEALRESQGVGPVAQIDVDPQGRVLSATRRALDLLQMDCAIGRSLNDLFPEEDRGHLAACMALIEDCGEAEHYCVVRVPRGAGQEPLWLRVVLARAGGKYPGYTLVLTDITDLELHRRELASDAGMFEALLQVAGVEFFEWHAAGRFRCSPGFRELLGLRADAALGNPLSDWTRLVHPEDRERMAERWKTPRTGTLPPAEYRLIGDDGKLRWLRSAAILRVEDGGTTVSSISGVVRDVSPEHSARALVAERTAILDVIPDIVVQFDASGAFVYLNPVAERFFRESGFERLPRSLADLGNRDPQLPLFENYLKEVFRDGERRHFRLVSELHPARPTLDIVASPVRDEAGGIRAVLIAARDVSRLVQAEVEARAALLRLQTLVDTARGAILVVADDGSIRMANRAFCETVGEPQSAVIGQQTRRYCFLDDADVLRETVRKLLGTGACSFPWRLRHANGSERWFQVDGSTFGESPDGRREFVFIATDIAEVRRERDVMLERERWLDRVLDDAGIGAFRFDRGLGRGEVVGAYARLMRQEQPHVVDRAELETLLPAAHRQRVGAQLERLLESAGKATIDFPLDFPASERRWLRAFLRNDCDYREGRGTLSSVIFDITRDRQQAAEHEELQRQVYQAQKTESLGVMAGGIAHDLNNMLMAALGQLNLAVAAVPPQSALGHYLSTVESVLGRMEGLTERMLAYAGQSASRMQPLDLAQLLEKIEPLLRASCGRHARWRMEIGDRPLVLKADSTQIEQVVLNFVQNAVDALGEQGGSVRLRLGRAAADGMPMAHLQWPLEAAGDYAVLSVRDDGPGIDGDSLRRIFEPFYTTKTTGRGLGLSVVQGIVKAHGGSIRVISEPGIGTEFRVFLPLLPDQSVIAGTEIPGAPAALPQERRPLLAIDDDEDVLAITVVMLEQCGFEVAAFLSGDDAVLELARSPDRYGGAIVDLTMPVKDGVTIARELRQQSPALPVLFVSGYAKEQPGDPLALIDGAQFLRKPFRVEQLGRALEELLR